jgi:tetratricopeptide (TPR) repeat protein
MPHRRYRLIGIVGLLVVLGLAGWFVAGQIQAWRYWRAGQTCLERDDAQSARRHLAHCVRAWPNSAEVRFLAARAARRCGELTEASQHLIRAAEYGWVKEAIDLERALARVQSGELLTVEAYLLRCLEMEHPESLLILEVVTPAFLNTFRLGITSRCVDRWLELNPEAAAAWHYRGMVAERRQQRPKAIEYYEEAVRLDPTRRTSRLALARALLRGNRPRDAHPHLEELLDEDPDNVEALTQLGYCYEALGQPDQAIAHLDRLLAQQPRVAEALHLRGKLDLDHQRPKEAIPFLRRAVAAAPFDREVMYTCLRCLRQTGTPKEIAEAEKRFAQVDGDLKLLAEVTGKIQSDPRNPDLRCRAGELFLRNGEDREGIRWLQSALAIHPEHTATHRLLAAYHEGKGQTLLASQHRALANRGQQ